MSIEMESEGMVAVVRGLRDAGLAVTLLDAGRQYTLVPENGCRAGVSACQTTGSQCSDEARHENGVQATDGRYASVYKMMHCHVTPTSPPELVSEFPPQRSEVYPGHGNFEVGGPGSGEGRCTPIRCNGFRGAMCWSDRGAVFGPRPSVQDDLFANSLRRYPSLTPDRSSEIVERLINFTQTKNCSKYRSTASPIHDIVSNASTHTHTHTGKSQRYEPDGNGRSRRTEESPTRDRGRKIVVQQEAVEPWRRSTFSKTSDVRYLRDVTKKVREGIRNLSAQSNGQSERPRTRPAPQSSEQRSVVNQCSTNTVNMEIQAAVQMVSREVVTVSGEAPSQRTVAVPLTSTSSLPARRSEGSVSCSNNVFDLNEIKHISETAEENIAPVDINVQTVSSAIEVSNHKFRNRKKSKSQEEIGLHALMTNEILDLIRPLYGCCPKKRSHRKFQRSNKNNIISLMLDDENGSYFNKRERTFECGLSKANSKFIKRSLAKIFHTEVNPYIVEDNLTRLLEDWINLIPVKKRDVGRSFNKELLFYDLFGYLKYAVSHLKGSDERCNLKSEIINRLELIPLDVSGNREVLENRLADILVNKLKRIKNKRSHHFLLNDDSADDIKSRRLTLKRLKSPSECELRSFVLNKLLLFLNRFELKIDQMQINGIEIELTEILLVSMDLLRCAKDKHVKMNIIELLTDYGMSEDRAILFSNSLLRSFKTVYIDNVGPEKIRSETFIVLSNTKNVKTDGNASGGNGYSIRSINENDIQANLERYTNNLCHQIDEWLDRLPIPIPQEKAFRQVVINDLAGDIVDRLRYIELNPESGTSHETELEHLKYQIFKWINKLVAEDNIEITKYAPDLMRRIKDIPVPMLSRPGDTNSKRVNDDSNVNEEASSSKRFSGRPPRETSLPRNQEQVQLNVGRERRANPSGSDRDGTQNSSSEPTDPYEKALQDIQDEFVQYVKDWVQLIPIETNTPEEREVAEKARLGIHNGLWKVINKLDSDPATYNNRFFYEDLLDEGIEDLLDCLPQTPELLSKKHLLKVRFIERTVDIHDKIKVNEEASYKHNLIKSIFNSLKRQGLTDLRTDDPLRVNQDMQVKKIVDDFLLCTNFRHDNKVEANIFKKRLLKNIEDFFEDLKQHFPQELKAIDISSYKTDIINILLKVRLPCEEIIKQEADSILLELEIEQWCNELPITPSEDFKEQYQRGKQRETLANKVKDFEKGNNQLTEDALKVEVSKFLENTPLKEDGNLNTNYISEQFINRIKNRPRQIIKDAYQTIPNYDEFSKDISFCSSFINPPRAPVQTQEPRETAINKSRQCPNSFGGQMPNASGYLSQENVSPKTLNNKSRVVIQEPPTYRTFNEGRPVSSSFYPDENSPQWVSLLDESQPRVQNVQNPQTIQDKLMVTVPPCCDAGVRSQRYEPDVSMRRPEEQSIPTTMRDLNRTRNLEEADIYKQQPYPFGNDENRYSERIRTSRGILGTSQIAGPSGYSLKTSQNVNSSMKPYAYGTDEPHRTPRSSHISRTLINADPSNLDECSISCQTIGKTKSGLKTDYDYDVTKEDNQMHASTNTVSGDRCCDPSMFSYTPQKDVRVAGPSGFSRRRTKSVPGSGPPGLTEEDDEDIPCRCIERYWKRSKRFQFEALDNLPPCFSLLFPYPYFF